MNTIDLAPDTIQSKSQANMEKAIEVLQIQFSKLRTGRASSGLLDTVRVTYAEGSILPLKHIATISVLDARTLKVTPWDKSQITAINKSILNAGLELNPVIEDG